MFPKCFRNVRAPSIVRGSLSGESYMHSTLKNMYLIIKCGKIHVFHALIQQIIQPEREVRVIHVCIFQGGRSKEQHSGNIVVREDPPGLSGSQEGEVEEEEGMVVERVESGTASHRDSAAGEHVHSSRSCHVYPPSHVVFPCYKCLGHIQSPSHMQQRVTSPSLSSLDFHFHLQ